MPEPSKYPYTTVPSKLRELLQKAPNMGKPDKVSQDWLRTAGWTSSNDRSVIPVLRFVGLTGADGRPTDLWDTVRAPSPPNKLRFGQAVKVAYSDLFQLYPDAHRKDAEVGLTRFDGHVS